MRIRWEDVDIRVYVDQVEAGVYKAVNFSYDDTINSDRVRYQGENRPRLDGTYDGGRGNIEWRLEKGEGDPRVPFDQHKAGIQSRDGSGQIRIVSSRVNPQTGAREGVRFDECIVNHGERAGEGSSVDPSWQFECADVKRVA